MVNDSLKKKIKQIFKSGYFGSSDDLVDVSDGSADDIHLVIVSRKFDGRYLKDKNDLIWSELMKHLAPEEWGSISLSVGLSPEELKAVI